MLTWIFAGLALTVFALFMFTRWKSAAITARFPPSGQFVPVEGGLLHVTRRAAARHVRATVLLLHGASGNEADMMLPLGDRLAARGFDVIAIDRPGHGASDRPGGRADASPARQAELVLQALAAMGCGSVLLVAHSLAGVMATNLALRHADLVQGLVLVSPVTHPWPGGRVNWFYHLAATPIIGPVFTNLFTLPFGLMVMRSAVASVFAPASTPDHYIERTGAARALRPATFRMNAEDVTAIFAFVREQAPLMGDIRAPTAILAGDTDGVVWTSIHSYGSAAVIPGAVLTILPGIGHSPHWNAPDAVVDAIEAVAQRSDVLKSIEIDAVQ